MIGENAYLGESARFAKVGSEAWGEVTEESGTVLFDGVIELEDSEGAVSLSGSMEVGKTLTITFGDKTSTATTADYEGAVVAMFKVMRGGSECDASIAQPPNETTAYIEIGTGSDDPMAGEFALKIVQTD